MGLPALVYNGVTISERDDFLCLTDMWRAAGSPESKRPADWARKEGSEFIEFWAQKLNVPREHIYQAERGAGGTTSAHWQIGMCFAQDLSPEFHAWCNEVVRAHMEGRHLPERPGDGSLVDLGHGLIRVLHRIEDKHAQIIETQIEQGKELRYIRDEVGKVLTIVQQPRAIEAPIKKEKPKFPPAVVDAFWDVIEKDYGSKCPITGKLLMQDGKRLREAHVEHFNGEKNGLEDGWIVHDSANQDMRVWRGRTDSMRLFDAFQVHVSRRFPNGVKKNRWLGRRCKSKRAASKTTSVSGQGSFGF